MTDTKRIHTQAELREVAASLGVRGDWHEPDEQGVNADVHGDHLDNAMGPQLDEDDSCGELNVVIYKDVEGEPGSSDAVAVVNLATLLAFACDAHVESRSVTSPQVLLSQAQDAAFERVERAEAEVASARRDENDLWLMERVQDVLRHDPTAAYIEVVTWPEEPSSDSLYDVCLTVVYDADGNQLDDLGSEGRSVGFTGNGTTWDWACRSGDLLTEGRIDVAIVRQRIEHTVQAMQA